MVQGLCKLLACTDCLRTQSYNPTMGVNTNYPQHLHQIHGCVSRFLMMAQGRFSLKGLGHLPEAQEMVGAMLAAQPAKRPTMQGIMAQPFWWSPARRLAFLIHLSDRVETEDREVVLTSFVSKFTLTFYPKIAGFNFCINLFLFYVCIFSLFLLERNPHPIQLLQYLIPLNIWDPPLPTVINTLPPMYSNMANSTWQQSVKPDMCLLPRMLMRLC